MSKLSRGENRSMTEAELLKLKALADAATPLPWFSDELWLTVDAVHPVRNDASGKTPLAFIAGYFGDNKQQVANAAFIAAARSAVPNMIRELEALRMAAKECADELEQWIDHHYAGTGERVRRERDMEFVLAVRAALSQGGGGE